MVVVAEKIDDSDVPLARDLFGPGVSPSERAQFWDQALKNMSPGELNLLAKDMDALKSGTVVTAALDAIITQVQAALKAAAKTPSDQRGMFAPSIAINIGLNTTLINWTGLNSWWGPR